MNVLETLDNLDSNPDSPLSWDNLTTLCISLLICETGVITILQMDFMKTEWDNACKVFSILPGTLQALNKY